MTEIRTQKRVPFFKRNFRFSDIYCTCIILGKRHFWAWFFRRFKVFFGQWSSILYALRGFKIFIPLKNSKVPMGIHRGGQVGTGFFALLAFKILDFSILFEGFCLWVLCPLKKKISQLNLKNKIFLLKFMRTPKKVRSWVYAYD